MQKGYNLIVNSSSIRSKKTLAVQKCDELIEMIRTYQKMIDETNTIYDTVTANKYRLVAHQYLDIVLTYLDKDFKEYINKLDTIIDTYDNYYTLTGIKVGKSDKDEV